MDSVDCYYEYDVAVKGLKSKGQCHLRNGQIMLSIYSCFICYVEFIQIISLKLKFEF